MRGVGRLIINLELGTAQAQSTRITIPALAVDQHALKSVTLENIPAGIYDGQITFYLSSSQEQKQAIRVRVEPNQDNAHTFHLSTGFLQILVRPIDFEGRTVIGAEIRIENIDSNFRSVRDWRGVSYKLRAGDYRVRILLPDLQTKTVPLQVRPGVQNYSLRVLEKPPEGTRREPRLTYTIPVDYRTAEGFWISSQTVNISPTGVCLLKRPLVTAEPDITVRLFVPTEQAPLECPARIRWSTDETTVPKMGVELFLTTTMKSHLAAWLDQRERRSDN